MMSKNPRPRSSPPPGLDKPPIPWTTGQTFTVRRHKPPPPFMSPYKIPRPPIPENLQQLTQLEYCLSHQPLEGETCDDTMSFTITKEIRVRDGKAAQVVVTNGGLVAKIYDPLFYPAYINSYTRDDVIMQADRDYCREAAAYTELHGPLEGTIIPKYHGSWTCDVSVETPDGPKKRPVRLILMEFIDGVCMEDLDLTGFTKNERSKIMVKTMEAEVAIFFHGVVHRDFAPRNVVIRGNIRSTDLQVVILDFSLAVVIRLAYPIDRRVYKLPPSPILRWSRQFPDFGDWVPPTRETLDEWLWKHWQGSPLYRPVGYGGQNVESG